MVSFNTSVRIEGSVEEVFSHFSDLEKMKEWLKGLKDIETVDGEAGQAGSTMKLVFHERGRDIVLKESIEEVRSNESYIFTIDHQAIASRTAMSFIPSGDSTTVKSDVDMRGKKLIWKLLLPFMKASIRRHQEDDLLRLKRVVETNDDNGQSPSVVQKD